jgi:hypothetical protein
MMYEVRRSDRNHVHHSPIENIQDALIELMQNPPLTQVTFTVQNKWEFKSTLHKLKKREIREVLINLQDFLED